MSIVFEAKVDVSEFEEWVGLTRENVIKRMKATLLEVSDLIHTNTNPLVPYKEGTLQESYMEAFHTGDTFVELEIGYSVISAPWDYALIQHVEYPVKRLRGQWYYLSEGIRRSRNDVMVEIEKDYLSALMGG